MTRKRRRNLNLNLSFPNHSFRSFNCQYLYIRDTLTFILNFVMLKKFFIIFTCIIDKIIALGKPKFVVAIYKKRMQSVNEGNRILRWFLLTFAYTPPLSVYREGTCWRKEVTVSHARPRSLTSEEATNRFQFECRNLLSSTMDWKIINIEETILNLAFTEDETCNFTVSKSGHVTS